jgi:hypothetical protein
MKPITDGENNMRPRRYISRQSRQKKDTIILVLIWGIFIFGLIAWLMEGVK